MADEDADLVSEIVNGCRTTVRMRRMGRKDSRAALASLARLTVEHGGETEMLEAVDLTEGEAT